MITIAIGTESVGTSFRGSAFRQKGGTRKYMVGAGAAILYSCGALMQAVQPSPINRGDQFISMIAFYRSNLTQLN